MDSRIRNLTSIATFKRAIFDLRRPKPTPMFKVNWLSGFLFLTRLRVGFSHLREHKLRDGFCDMPNPICYCLWNAVENTENYLLHCSNFANQRTLLFDDLRNIGINYGPLYSSTFPECFYFVTLSFLITLIAVQFMQLLNLLNQSIVLSDLYMINITILFSQFTLFFKLI